VAEDARHHREFLALLKPRRRTRVAQVMETLVGENGMDIVPVVPRRPQPPGLYWRAGWDWTRPNGLRVLRQPAAGRFEDPGIRPSVGRFLVEAGADQPVAGRRPAARLAGFHSAPLAVKADIELGQITAIRAVALPRAAQR
jgi:hypothetical protein